MPTWSLSEVFIANVSSCPRWAPIAEHIWSWTWSLWQNLYWYCQSQSILTRPPPSVDFLSSTERRHPWRYATLFVCPPVINGLFEKTVFSPLLSTFKGQRSAQRSVVRSRGDIVAWVETLGQFRVKLALVWPEGSGVGKAMWKATPTAKIRNETKKASPRRKISWVTESSAWGLVFEASPSIHAALASCPAFSSWSRVSTGL